MLNKNSNLKNNHINIIYMCIYLYIYIFVCNYFIIAYTYIYIYVCILRQNNNHMNETILISHNSLCLWRGAELPWAGRPCRHSSDPGESGPPESPGPRCTAFQEVVIVIMVVAMIIVVYS